MFIYLINVDDLIKMLVTLPTSELLNYFLSIEQSQGIMLTLEYCVICLSCLVEVVDPR